MDQTQFELDMNAGSDRTPLDIWIDIVDIKPVIDTSNYKLLHCVVTLLEKSFGQEYTSYPIRK